MNRPMVYRDPQQRNLSEEQMNLLGQIFRVIAKEITSDLDKENMAPGEIGIDYVEGIIYFRNPHTGNLIAPYGYPGMLKLLKKVDKNGNLNADTVAGIHIYKDVSELSNFAGSLTPDNLVSFGMTEEPSLFVGNVQGSKALGWPTEDGILIVYKYDEENVICTMYDRKTFSRWIGNYDYQTHQLVGFITNDEVAESFAEFDTADEINITVGESIHDLSCVVLRAINGLRRTAKVTINGIGPYPFTDWNGQPLTYDIANDTTIMLVYDELNSRWILRNASDSAVTAGVDVLNKRISDITKSVTELTEQMSNDIKTLKGRIYTAEFKLENFNAAWVKSIDGSTLPVDVIPFGTTNRNFSIERLGILGDTSNTGYPNGAGNGDTIFVISTENSYFIIDQTKLGTPDYMAGLKKNNMQFAQPSWSNIVGKPTTLDGYGITDAMSSGDLALVNNRIDALITRMATAENTLKEINKNIGIYKSSRTIAERLDDIYYGPGTIELVVTNWTADGGESEVEEITGFNGAFDKLFVNYNQTILKVGIDYDVYGNGVRFYGHKFAYGEVVQFVIFKQKTSEMR